MRNARDNLLSLYRRRGYDFVPVEMNFCPAIQKKFMDHNPGLTDPSKVFDFSARSVPGPRCRHLETPDWMKYYRGKTFKEGTSIDGNGVAHEPGSEAAVHMTRMHHPMEGFSSLEEYQAFPYLTVDPDETGEVRRAVLAAHDGGYAAVGHMACTVWETSWYMRGMENLMVDMLGEEDTAVYHLDRITGISCDRAAVFARAGVDILAIGDDIGMQSSIMMSIELYREWIKPRLARVIAAARAINPGIIILYHTCGYVIPLIEDLIEAGIDVLNPVQPECMDFSTVHERFGDRLSFNGTIGTQTTMPFGTPEEVRAEVFRNLDIAGEKGGLLPCPTHLLEPEVPWENILAYVGACREYQAAGR